MNSNARFSVRADRRHIRTAYSSNRFLLAEVVAPQAEAARHRPPVNLAFVLDRSGSMAGRKIELARRAVEEAIGQLREDDRFSVVAYDDQIETIVPTTRAVPEARIDAVHRLAAIDARGSTNLGEGWLRGCEQVALHLAAEGVNRALLLTDGLANVGITDHEELVRHAGELRARGVSTSTFGLGNDFDESLLQGMADAGGGHFYYIASEAQIRDHIASEVGEALQVVARDVRIEVAAPEGVRVEPLSPFRAEESRGRLVVLLGDVVSGQLVSVVLRVNFPYGDIGQTTSVASSLSDREGRFDGSPITIAWSYADDRTNDLQDRDREVDRAVARIFAARARQEAVRLNRAGAFEDAARGVRAVANRIRGYAGRDPELLGIVAKLEGDLMEFSAPMPEQSRKTHHFAASNMARSRDVQGRATRGPRGQA